MIQHNIGNTPIRSCKLLREQCGATVYIKEEFHNPGLSIKDRVAWYMMEDAIRSGKIKPGGTFVEASSGNTGLSMAILARKAGYQAKIFVSETCSQEKRENLIQEGASLEICANSNGPDEQHSTQYAAQKYADQHPEAYFTNQYFNPANIESHFKTTGPEIWQQTAGKITHLIAGVGTGGTISGTGRFLKQQNPEIRIIGVEPEHSIYQFYLRHGVLPKVTETALKPDPIEGIGRTFVPGSYDPSIVDQIVQVSEVESRDIAQWYREQTGHLSGFSTAAVIAALRRSKEEMGIDQDSLVVLIAPDHGERYISKLYQQPVLENQQEERN